MVKVNNVLTNIFFWLIIALTCILANNWMPLVSDPSQGFTKYAFYGIACIAFFLVVVYFILEHKDNKLKLHPVYFPVITMLTIMLVAMIWVQPSETFVNPDTGFAWTVNISFDQCVRFSILTVLGMIIVYMILVPYSSKQVRAKQVLWIGYIVVAFCFVSIILSFIFDLDAYKSVFQVEVEQQSVRSIYNNPNTYGYFLMFGIFALAVIHYHHRTKFNYILMLVLYVAMIFTSCSTTFAISSIFIPVFIFVNILMGIKRKPLTSLVKALIFIAIIIAIFVTIYVLEHNKVSWYMGLSKFLNEEILHKDYETISGRTFIWKNMLGLLDGNILYIMFGRGNYVSTEYMRGFSVAMANGDFNLVHTQSMHNGFIEILLKSGVVGLSLYIVMIIIFLVSLVYLTVKKQGRYAFTFFLIFIGWLVHSCIEQQYYFGSSFNNIMATLLFFMPPINAMRHMIKPDNVYQVEHKDAWRYKLDIRKFVRFSASILFASICVIVPLFAASVIYNSPQYPRFIFVIAACGVLTILGPYVLANWYQRSKTRVTFIVRAIINSVIIVGLTLLTHLLISKFTGIYVTKWMQLAILSGYTLINAIGYNLFTRIKFWLVPLDVIGGCLLLPKTSLLYTIFLAPALVVSISVITTFDWFWLGFVLCTNLIMYFTFYILIPMKTGGYYVSYVNEQLLARMREITYKTKI